MRAELVRRVDGKLQVGEDAGAILRARLPEPTRREHHAALASALEQAGADELEALADHWFGAGEPARGVIYALRAARAAEQALAFHRAARLYQDALAAAVQTPVEKVDLQIRLGEALSHAGQGKRAAEVYLDAAECANADQALELTLRAADELLRAGELSRGLALMGRVATRLGVALPGSARAALPRLVWARARLRLRRLAPSSRRLASSLRPKSLSAEQRRRLDALWAIGRGLAVVDVGRAAYFHAKHLDLALSLGDPNAIARGLGTEASHQATLGHARRARNLVRLGEELAHQVAAPYALATASFLRGFTVLQDGRWRSAVTALDRAGELFDQRCTGASWERATSRLSALFGLAALGELRELSRRRARLGAEAAERNDAYVTSSLAIGWPVLAELARSQVVSVRSAAERALAAAPVGGFHVQHVWGTVALTYADLYEGDARGALARMDEAWPAMQRSLLARVQLLRVQMIGLRAHCALAAATAGGASDRGALIVRAERLTARLEREQMVLGDPWARLLRAAICRLRGDDARAAGLAIAAASGFEELEMALHAAATRLWVGGCLGEPARSEQTRAAHRWMAAQEVRDPERLAAVLTPELA
jgi:hypothetical protein